MRAMYFPLSLPLFMLRIGADDPHHTFAVDHFALVAHLFDGRSYFHVFAPADKSVCATHLFINRTILPRPGSCGDNSTCTLSPGRTLTKFVFAAPAACARTTASFSSFTFTTARGSSSTTTASTDVMAASKPRDRWTSPPRNARNAPTANDPW